MEALWEFWYMQSLAVSGDFKTAVATTTNSESTLNLKYGQAIALQVDARETGEWRKFFQHLEESFNETGDPHFLLEFCRLKAQRQEWNDIAERGEQLVKEFGTSDILRLTVIAAFNAKKVELCLKLIDEHRNMFGQGRLTVDMRRMRVSCLHILGFMPEAIAETQALVRDETTTEHLLGLANLHFAKGDLESLIIIIRQLLQKLELSSTEALKFASQIHYKDRQLAVSLWKNAIYQGLPDDLVMNAVILGSQLGLDNEMSLLLERMRILASQQKGGIQVKKIEDFIQLKRQWNEQITQTYSLYQNGAISIHLLAKQLNRPLVDFYHRFPQENEIIPDTLTQIPLFIRHGSRRLISGFPNDVPKWRLNLDITAILLAAHLDILPDVERIFKPLRIPYMLIPALSHMRENLVFVQRSRLNIYQQIVDLVKNERLNVVTSNLPPDYSNKSIIAELGEKWVALFEEAKSGKGYLIDLFPLRRCDLSDSPVILSNEFNQSLVSCCDVVEALWEEGPLSKEEYYHAREWFNQKGYNLANHITPQQGTPLYCHGITIELLAEANLLDIICERFNVYIESSEYDRIRDELKENDQKRKTAEWLDILINRINIGIDNKTYQILPFPADKKEILALIQDEPPEFACLISLMGLDAQKDDIIWGDDRWTTGYARWYGIQIIGVNEILKALVSVKVLTQSGYYAKITQLRKANIRFIPLEADEILYHLRQANIVDGEVKETEGLRTLRCYMAACLLQGNLFQHPTITPENYILTLRKA